MSKHFKYSLLKYEYSQALGEVLNVGLLLFFPNEWRFIYPKKLTRLKDFYPDVEEEHLKIYLDAFEKQAHQLNQKIQSNEIPFEEGFSLDNFMEKVYAEFLPYDSSALYFSKARTSVLYSENRDKIAENLYEEYFFPYEFANDRNQKDESMILRAIRNYIKEIGKDIFEHHFRNQEAKQISNNKTSLTIDLHWKNGKTHLVHPISLDLKRDSSIDRKANQYFGKFIQLRDEIQKGDYVLDIPVARPAEQRLFKDYDKALYILEDVEFGNVIEEENLKNYAQKAVNELASHR